MGVPGGVEVSGWPEKWIYDMFVTIIAGIHGGYVYNGIYRIYSFLQLDGVRNQFETRAFPSFKIDF